jgi:hypothetical protein
MRLHWNVGYNDRFIETFLFFSFIHTGHGSHKGKTWGQPGTIDDVYLRNPLQPPDIIGIKAIFELDL